MNALTTTTNATGNATTNATPTPPTSQRTRWLSLGAIALAVALVIMDATIANVALPVVIRELGLRAADAQWINAIYSLVFAAFIISAGRLGDLFGRRRIAASGLSIFLIASLAAGAAHTPLGLIIARTFQGLGAAAVLPATLSTINTLFRGKDRSIAFAVYGSMIGGMAAVGPLVGGWLATDISWRWAFWLNIPFGLIALIGMLAYTPNTRDTHAERSLKAFDLSGVALISTALAALVFALIESSTLGWATTTPIAAVALVLIAIFLRHERHRSALHQPVLVDLSLFHLRSFRLGASTAFLVSLGEFGLIFALPLLLQGALGYSALNTGWLMMCLAAGTFLASAVVPHLIKTLGKKQVIILGLGSQTLMLAALAWAISSRSWVMAIILAAYGFGIGLANAQLTDTTMQDVPVELSGMASGLQTTIRQLGSAIGIAGLGGFMIARLSTLTQDGLIAAGIPRAQELTRAVHDSVGAIIPELAFRDPVVAAPAIQALLTSSRWTLLLAAGVLCVAFINSLRLAQDAQEEKH